MAETKKVIITDEIRAKLAGFSPVSKIVGIAFTPEKFLAPEFKAIKPVFYLRGWTVEERAVFVDFENRTTAQGDELVRKCVVNFENLIDLSNGEEIVFEKDHAGDLQNEIYEHIPNKTIQAILVEIIRISGLSSEEKEDLE